MKLQDFGALLADEHQRTRSACEALTAAFAELNSLHRKPNSENSVLGATVLTVARQLLESASTEVLDVLPWWFPKTEPTAERVLHDQLPVFLRTDREVAVLAESPTNGILVRGRFAAALFDLLWERTLTPVRQQVLRLLAAGLDDAAVAAATGRSIRTVRAHVASLMAELGAPTRLAAGAEAARRGWL